MDVNADAPDEMLEPVDGQMDGQWKALEEEEEEEESAKQEVIVESDLVGTAPDPGAMTTSTSSTTSTTTQVNPTNPPAGSGRRKKRRKKRNKTRLERASQPRVRVPTNLLSLSLSLYCLQHSLSDTLVTHTDTQTQTSHDTRLSLCLSKSYLSLTLARRSSRIFSNKIKML